jgi:hypothetical protein
MLCVVTYNQINGWPEFEYPDLHYGPGALDAARAERDDKQARTAARGRGERHVIAEVIELEDDDG